MEHTLKNYRRTIFSKVTEEEFRCSLYNSNNCSKPDDGIERFVQRIFHPSVEDLREESELGL